MKQEAASLVIGADGIMGGALITRLASSGRKVLGTTRRPSTVTPERIFLDLREKLPDWDSLVPVQVAYICGGITSLDQCRQNPDESARINVQQTVALATTLLAQGARVVFPSTNLVFDGNSPYCAAEAAVCPQTKYGRQKAEAERRLLALGEAVAVVRFTKVLNPQVPLVKRWMQALRQQQPIYPFSDLVLAPVPLVFAVEAMGLIGEGRFSGIFQVSGDRDISYADLARHLARRLEADPDLVQPTTSVAAGVEMEHLPRHTTLDASRLQESFGLGPPGLATLLDDMGAPSHLDTDRLI
jgi:dTDP-4-dehydrorhamnose reductase